MRWGEGRVWLRADFGLGLAECSRLRFDGSCAPALFPLELGLDLLHQCVQVVLLVDAELLVDVRGVGAGGLVGHAQLLADTTPSQEGKHAETVTKSRNNAEASADVRTTFVPAERLSSEANDRPQNSTSG